jgi:F-type H+-transporting ATPase subunit a
MAAETEHEHDAQHVQHADHGAHKANPLDPKEVFSHVEDADYIHVPEFLAPEGSHGQVAIPQPFAGKLPFEFKLTKFMVIELAVAILIFVFFVGLARALKGGAIPRGRFRNLLEAFLLYFRDNVARPCIGHHDGDKFVPFLWTIFFFILGCNLFGMIPWMGSPTGSLSVTATLAVITFVVVIVSGMKKMGAVGFWKAQVPHMDVPGPLKFILIPMIFLIEVFGLIVKHGVLAVRLLANMMGGHVVLAVILAFIAASAQSLWWWGVMPASVLGAVALSMLELFVAFLQAYIFTFLSALFIGMAVHPH